MYPGSRLTTAQSHTCTSGWTYNKLEANYKSYNYSPVYVIFFFIME